MVCKTACKQCAQTGLPILFTRYAVAYSSTAAGVAALEKLKPSGKFKTQPGGVALQAANYNVRMLRAGYLYVRLASASRVPEWLAFVVHPHGYLTAFDHRHPEDAASLAACSPQEWGANRSLVWIKDAKDITRLNYLFNPDAINPEHLKKVIEADLGRYTQSFDVAAWANGNTSASESAVPDADPSRWAVADFRALKDEALSKALEPQLYGLMGSSAIERGWGDYEKSEVVQTDNYLLTGEYAGQTRSVETEQIRQLDYDGAHGMRLRNMAKYLADHQGAIVACDDAVGIAQELGHLQAEAQSHYTRWQVGQAEGAAKDVTNEWVYQTAIAAKGLHALIQKGAVHQNDQTIDHLKARRQMSGNPFRPGSAEYIQEKQRVDQMYARSEKGLRDAANQEARTAGDKEFSEYFDNQRATAIINEQGTAYKDVTRRLTLLGQDQADWLRSGSLKKVIDSYSGDVAKVDQPGGGAALALQLAHCAAGTESNEPGKQLLKNWDLFGDNVLARLISFNVKQQSDALKKLFDDEGNPPLQNAEPDTGIADWVTDRIKFHAGRLGLGDKALAFMEDGRLKPICEAGALRKMAWPLHVVSLLSVKMMQGINGLPVIKAEAWLVKHAALSGVATMGKAAEKYAGTLAAADRDRMRNAVKKLQSGSYKASAAHAAPNVRAAAFGAVFDVSLAILKGYQFSVKPDGRTASEMFGNLMQGLGSLADWRAKAFEETVFKGVKGINLFTVPAMVEAADDVSVFAFRALRFTALKFLGGAALFSIWWDLSDARTSQRRGDAAMAAAQYASVAGTAFTMAGACSAYLSIQGSALISAATYATVAAALGFIGGVLVLSAVVALWWFKKEDWVNWLMDNPLYIKNAARKPVHISLQESMQKLANAENSIGVPAILVGERMA